MKIMVINRNDQEIRSLYENVKAVVDVFDENRNFCHQIQMEHETATFPACEWKFLKLDWVEMF